MEAIVFEPNYMGWQKAARTALIRELHPDQIIWQPDDTSQSDLNLFNSELVLLSDNLPGNDVSKTKFRVPRDFVPNAKLVACHRAETRWHLLYRMLWRLIHGEPHLLAIATDPDVCEFEELSKAIRRDVHKMRAFVRFREIAINGGPWFVAWFEPHHLIVEINAPFFVDRFFSMKWSILTPDRCAHWDGRELRFTPGANRSEVPAEDLTEDLWRTYYRNIFNPARVKIGAMKKEMPTYYWRNLPESKIIPQLLAEAPTRTAQMVAASQAKKWTPDIDEPAPVPATKEWEVVHEAAKTCRACPLWRNATCVVFGEGPRHAKILIVGEQPGDQEDRAGQPFVGPAGKLLDRALLAAEVDRSKIYVTNAVKHFKWEPRGKRRLHQKPNAREIAACRPWLEKEIELLRPKLIVCLGATAAHSVIGPGIKVTEDRGRSLATAFNIPALVTVHPSSLLRQTDRNRADDDFSAFVADLKKIPTFLNK